MVITSQSGLRIVSVGGGTGLSTLLSGLKEFVGSDFAPTARVDLLTAIVTVTDDGGSSGRLREEFQMLAPGDIRNCIAALAEDEHLLTKLLRYRFDSGGELSGHSFGNLLLTALTNITGDFLDAIKVISEVLAIKGRIFPSTMENASLLAELADGRIITGESKITGARSHVNKLWLSHECHPLPETLAALQEADIITIGPGSLFTSIIPNLLVNGIVEAICQSSALKIYICNIMTQPGETEGFGGEDHLRTLLAYSPRLQFDYVIVNSSPISAELREKYLADGSVPVEFTSNVVSALATGTDAIININAAAPPHYRVVRGDLLSENSHVRHDPHKLARMIIDLYLAEPRTPNHSARPC
ncbi:MAG: uridine diphosphate-N-acetylglucosamine-binding protein YvcK [Acidobacteria bacterium]|nr:uridine diphosphate-N-acetylglucosamine-binding protein YvcK [Acidobacteriota bacterium]